MAASPHDRLRELGLELPGPHPPHDPLDAVVVHGGLREGGTVCGVGEDGSLRLRDDSGEWSCRAGEVSVRRREA